MAGNRLQACPGCALQLLMLYARVRWQWFRRARYWQKGYYMKRNILLVRHGQTQWNVDHLLPGQLPGITLNDEGRRQAECTARALAEVPFSLIVSSPLERAIETTQILKGERAVTIEMDAGLADTNLGRWAGKKVDDLERHDAEWQAYAKNPTVAPEGVETSLEVQQRAVATVERYRQRADVGDWIVFVAHADVIKLIVGYYMHVPPECVHYVHYVHIDNASVTLLSFDDTRPPVLVNLNWTPQPGWLKPKTSDAPATLAPAAASDTRPAEATAPDQQTA